MKFQSDTVASAGQKILLVDDVPQGTVARKSILKDLGYTVETAENAQQALDLMAGQIFDLMVTDYKMPGMNGIDLIGHVKIEYPGMKTVMLSGMADTFDLTEECTGADAVLTKSENELNQLTRTIKKLLARKPARKPVGSAVTSKQRHTTVFMVKSS